MNNPLNIEYNPANDWQGAIRPHNGQRFDRFEHVKYNIRAGAIILKNYQKKHGLKTIKQIIERFAPESDGNDTKNYIKFVSEQTHIPDSQTLDLNDHNVLFPILKAMCKMESNFNLTKSLYYESISI